LPPEARVPGEFFLDYVGGGARRDSLHSLGGDCKIPPHNVVDTSIYSQAVFCCRFERIQWLPTESLMYYLFNYMGQELTRNFLLIVW